MDFLTSSNSSLIFSSSEVEMLMLGIKALKSFRTAMAESAEGSTVPEGARMAVTC